MDELVGFASAQPLVTFGVGCATGAVVGGLVAVLVGRGRRRSLERRILDLEIMVQQQGYPDILSESHMESTMDLAQDKASSKRSQAAPVAPVQQEQQVQQAQLVDEQEQQAQAEQAQTQEAHAEPQQEQAQPQQEQAEAEQEQKPTQAAQEAPEQAQAAAAESHKGEHSVSKVLFSRLSSGAFDGVPVITRGAQREPDLESTAKRVAMRRMNPIERAKVIDKRIPRFDESMFPESPVVEEPAADEFEQAMNAMENSMVQEMEVQQSEPDFEFTQPEGHPEIDNAAAYVDYLVNDEMEINRSYRARRFSRSHLTVIEGTGDLSKARQRTHVARHLASVSKEA
ncbi:MAG: hypothetical protein Q4B54_09130 [Coriobacteriales bacterium]|nr:hypothetical protein [Coriobacteriales bacterium]